jgi:hypothetical protein
MNIALANVACEEGRPITALDHLNHALALSQTLGGTELLLEVLQNLAVIHLWRGDEDSATLVVQQALAINPRDVITRLVRLHLTLMHVGAANAVAEGRAIILDAQVGNDLMILACAVMQVACARLHLGAAKEAQRLFEAVQGVAQARQLSRRWARFLSPHFVKTAPLTDPFLPPPALDSAALERLATAVSVLLRTASPP